MVFNHDVQKLNLMDLSQPQTATYCADPANASPVWFLVHSGCLVDLAEEEVDLLLELLGRWDYSCTSKLRIW